MASLSLLADRTVMFQILYINSTMPMIQDAIDDIAKVQIECQVLAGKTEPPSGSDLQNCNYFLIHRSKHP